LRAPKSIRPCTGLWSETVDAEKQGRVEEEQWSATDNVGGDMACCPGFVGVGPSWRGQALSLVLMGLTLLAVCGLFFRTTVRRARTSKGVREARPALQRKN